jgi:hypothetical protein
MPDQTLKMEAIHPYDALVTTYKTTESHTVLDSRVA